MPDENLQNENKQLSSDYRRYLLKHKSLYSNFNHLGYKNHDKKLAEI
jgi:hypothetical protein